MTFGEMLGWTKRFNQILGASQTLKSRRLASLMSDLEQAYQIPGLKNEEYSKNNPFVIQLYRAVSEARTF